VGQHKRPESSQDQWQRELSESLRKAGEQLAVGLARQVITRATKFAEQAGEHQRSQMTNRETRRADRERHRTTRKAERRQNRRAERYGQTTMLEAWTLGGVCAVALVLIAIGVLPWWVVFIALAFARRIFGIVNFHAARKPDSTLADDPLISQAERDPRDARIDEVCDKLKAALKDAPESVRLFLSKPDETVELLRKTSHDLLQRELSLRSVVRPEETTRLGRERTALQARIAMEPDEIVRQRLVGALAALDNQQQQHAEMAKAADRLEAERTRLGYTLDGLYAQVMRLRSAEAGSPDLGSAGLRTSLDQLRDEMSALAEAVEDVNRSPAGQGFEAPETFAGGTRAAREPVR
jgi:hypothetical protein